MYLDREYLEDQLAECEWQLKLLAALETALEEESND